jgi:Cu/Zn superoxide dismutase
MRCFTTILALACVAFLGIAQVNAKTIVADFDNGGVTGTITFTQANIGAPTTIDVKLYGIAKQPNKWHIHSFPLLPGAGCGSDSVGGHFNPTKVTLPYVGGSCSGATCEVGDLSGKHGKLNATNFDFTFTDNTLPLFGKNSIEGRAIVIHASDGSRMSCASVGFPAEIATAVAHFDGGVLTGSIMLRQVASDPSSETSVTVDLKYAIPDPKVTYDHKWHIHVSPIASGNNMGSTLCTSAGGHYNPLSVDPSLCAGLDRDTATAAQYGTTCEVGDLSGKHGKLTIGDGKYQFTDANLPLTGPNRVTARSIVIHAMNSTGPRMDCASLDFKYRTVEARFTNGGVGGTITFQQAYSTANTTVKVDLVNVENNPNKWHVHKFPQATKDDCGPDSVGGHYNPLNVPLPYPSGSCVDGTCEVGDLSGKHGKITSATFKESYDDASLPLFGKNSVVGRSIVIHASDGARMACADIAYPSSAPTRIVVTTFVAPLKGTITFMQLADDPRSETSVLVNILNAEEGTTSANHKWHVHQTPASEKDSSGLGDCQSTGGHYNPYFVDLSVCGTLPASATAAELGLKCEVGDLKGKNGALNLPASKGSKYFFTDANLPLSGQSSVAARSVVIHGKDLTAPRLACASMVDKTPQPEPDCGSNCGSPTPMTMGMIAAIAVGGVLGAFVLGTAICLLVAHLCPGGNTLAHRYSNWIANPVANRKSLGKKDSLNDVTLAVHNKL